MKFPIAYFAAAVVLLSVGFAETRANVQGGNFFRPVSSTTILLSHDQEILFVANPDSGSVSVLDVGSNDKLPRLRWDGRRVRWRSPPMDGVCW